MESKKLRILFVCTGNSCRSQMAEALSNHFFKDKIEAFSAGLEPKGVHPLAKKVLEEMGIETHNLRSKSLSEFDNWEFDMVVTLCDSAKENCPYFPNARAHIHAPFPDPSETEDINCFRYVRDKILNWLKEQFG